MDPISVTASIITLITAAGSIVRCLEHVKSRMNPSAELFSIMNTVFPTQLLKSIGGQVLQLQVTALQATLVVVRYENEALKNCRIPAAALAYKGLPDTIERLQQYIDRLVDFAHSNLLNKGKGLSRLGLSKGKRKALTRIQDDISDAHRNLQILLHTANLRRNQELLSKIEQASLVQDINHMQTSTTLDEVITRLSAAQITGVGDSGGSQQTQNEFESMLAQTTPDSSNATSTHLSVTTSLPLKACDWTCNCQCHVQTRSQTPQWLSAVVGTLFYASTRTPSLDIRPCNNTNCFRTHPSSSCRLTYYFPSWIMRTVLVCATWNKLEGMNSSWMVTMPREIPLYSACWHFIESGSLGKVRDLLQSRQMSPYDIGPDGVSVLHWAESRWQFEICSLLTAMGANWHFMDRSGRSPSDGAWRKILMNDDSNASVMKFRALVGSDDSKDLQLGPLHRIILGLSSIDFTMQLDLEPSRVNDADWLGVTPLMWAALRNNHTYIGLLLLHGARPDLKDSEGRTALHHAARVGSIRCVDALLGAGADPNTVDNRGFTPLHDVAFSVESTETANMIISLHSHCANIEARDEMGRSPVFIASLTGSQTALKTLIECRADVNALDFVDVPPIVLAILRGHGEIVRQLFSAGAMPSWGPVDHIVDNVLIKAALNGTKEMMDILADSAIPPIECDIPRIRHYFQTYRKVLYGAPCSPEEELAAFQRLLDKKAIALTCAENSDLPEETNSVSRKESDEYHDSNDEDAVVDVFEDAQENMSCLHESTLLETLPVVVST